MLLVPPVLSIVTSNSVLSVGLRRGRAQLTRRQQLCVLTRHQLALCLTDTCQPSVKPVSVHNTTSGCSHATTELTRTTLLLGTTRLDLAVPHALCCSRCLRLAASSVTSVSCLLSVCASLTPMHTQRCRDERIAAVLEQGVIVAACTTRPVLHQARMLSFTLLSPFTHHLCTRASCALPSLTSSFTLTCKHPPLHSTFTPPH